MADGRKLRVIQCGTGLAGKEALAAIIERDDLELVALMTYSPENEGRDAGSFCGLPDTGIRGTADKEVIFATPADIVVYMMFVPDVDDICRFLSSGRNVVTTGGLLYPAFNDPETDERLRQACEQGGTSFFVSGINPGFADEVLPTAMTVLSRKWDRVRIHEYADCSKYPHKGIIDIMGFGYSQQDVDEGKVADMQVMVNFFAASVAALAHGLGVDLDEVRQTREFKMADRDLHLPFGTIEKGTIAGQRWRWVGVQDGVEKVVQETFWIVAFDLGEGWPRSGESDSPTRWEVIVDGTPSLRCIFDSRETFIPGVTPDGKVNPSGAATAMAVVNRLHSVVAARPGQLTAIDLPQPRFGG